MSSGGLRGQFLYNLPSPVIYDFCRAMDVLPDPDWTRFASEVLLDVTAVRLAARREQRTDSVVRLLEDRNERVGYLVDVLERLQLLRQRDILLSSTFSPSTLHPPPRATSPRLLPPVEPKQPEATPTLSTTQLSTAVDKGGGGGAAMLPPPAPPPSCLLSCVHQQAQPAAAAAMLHSAAVMCWTYEEVHAGTEGFSAARRLGEGGFGVVYRASLGNATCAVKRLKEDGELDWDTLRDSFQTEVEKLSRFRHQNIVDLLGFSVGGGTMCLIYEYMLNGSLEDQLHNDSAGLSWSQRISIVTGASAALQFLHCPPGGQMSLIHGDVKSSNILLDRHLVAKLSDFGLARFRPRGPSGCMTTQTGSIGRTETVRGTLAYLPDEYLRNGKLGTTLDVFSLGVVLLEVLTGRRAVERDRASPDRYLKDLVEDLDENRSGSSPDVWLKHLDPRLTSGGAVQPPGYQQVAALACRSLDKFWKKRPKMITVLENLDEVLRLVQDSSCSSSSWNQQNPPDRPPRPPQSLDSSLGVLVQQLSRLGPGEDTVPPQLSSSSSSSSSSSLSFTAPHPLHSSSSLPPSSSSSSSLPPSSSSLPPSSSSSLPPSSSSSSSSSSSFLGPCETDESRGFSQYLWSNGTRTELRPPSVPTEDQDLDQGLAPPPAGGRAPPGPLRVPPAGPDPRASPGKSLQSTCPGHSDDGRNSQDFRGPEESDELDFLPAKRP